MHLSRLAVFGLLAAGWACAQDTDVLEIRGFVAEVGQNVGVAGAQITVYQFSKTSERTIFATGTTDSQGNFQFHPSQAGAYYVEAKKPEYLATMGYQGPTKSLPEVTGSLANVSHDHPQEYVRLALMRLTELTGRVFDENEQPLAALSVEALDSGPLHTSMLQGSQTTARTNRDGSFSIKSLPPGEYIVRVSGAARFTPRATKFSNEDLNATGQGVGTSYWPGVRDASTAAKVTTVPGTPLDLSILRMRKEPLYRVRVSVRGCRPGDDLRFSLNAAGRVFSVLQGNGTSANISFLEPFSALPACDDFLVRDLPPGSYEFALQSKPGWALTPVEVVNKNLFVTIPLVPEADVTGTVIAAHADMPPLGLDRVRIQLSALRSFGGSPLDAVSSVSGGKFSLKGVRGPQHAVIVSGLSGAYYVKEIRSNGAVAPDGIVTLGPGSQIEIVIDDQPATLTGAVTDGGKPFSQPKIYVRWWPASRPPGGMANLPTGTGNAEGRFQIAGLPPGEYRVLAVPSGPIPDGASEWNIGSQLWDRAERVILERGKQKEVALKLTDPFLER